LTLRIALVDCDELVREGRSLLIQSQADNQIVYQTGDAAQALGAVGDYLLDLILVDIRIPGWQSDNYLIELSNRLDRAGNDAAILAMASFTSPQLELACLRAGATAIFSADQGVKALLAQIKVLGTGEQAIEPSKLKRLLRAVGEVPAPNSSLALSLEGLDEKQRQVVEALVAGQSDSQISKSLDLTKYRVTKFIESLRQTNGFRTRTQLAIELIGLGAF
jgi:DNA-binding NarL/FixJ family response regulator